MITLKTSVVVPEDRTITLALPPETPVGSADLQVTIESSANGEGPTNDSKFNREWTAFHAMLPELLAKYPGQYVAIHDGRVVGSGPDSIALSLAAHKEFGDVAILVRQVNRYRIVLDGPQQTLEVG